MAASDEVSYVPYSGEEQLPLISALVDRDLSEPYSIYTYRYFLHNWPALTFLVRTSRCWPAPTRS